MDWIGLRRRDDDVRLPPTSPHTYIPTQPPDLNKQTKQIAVVDPSDAAGAAAFVDRLREVGRAQQGLVEEHFVLGA